MPPESSFRSRSIHRRPLPEADADGLMRQLSGYGSSLLQTGLDVLDKPGRAVRGTLAGHFRELGNLVPFSDTLGITDAADRVSGRDLTNALGITAKRDARGLRGWGQWGAGLAAEMATDPLTYLTGGVKNALTPAGRVATKAGALQGWGRADILRGFDATESALLAGGRTPEQIAHLIDAGRRVAPASLEAAATAAGTKIVPREGLGALAGFGSPFGDPRFLFGTGPKAVRVAEMMDRAGDTLKYGNALGRWANGLFDHRVNESVGAASQKAWAKYGTPAVEPAKLAGRDETYRVLTGVDAAIRSGVPEEEVLRAARQAAEGVSLRGASPGAVAVAPAIGAVVRDAEARQLAEAVRIGLPLRDAADEFTAYAPRQGVDLDAIRRVASGQPGRIGLPPGSIDRNILPVATGANFHRDDLYRNIPGGTEMVNDWARRFAGDPGGLGLPGIRRAMLRDMVGELRSVGTPITRPVVKQLGDKADAVAGKLAGLSPDYATHGIGLYSPHLAADLARSGEQHARTMGTANAVMGFVGDNARLAGSLPSDAVPVGKVLDDLGLVTRAGDPAKGLTHRGAMVEAYRKLARQGAGMVDPLLAGKFEGLRKAVDQYAVPRDLYDELVQSHGKWSMPEVLKGPSGLFADLTRTFKGLVYPIWPASHFRNAFSAGLNNLLGGTSLSDHAAQFALMRGTASADQLRRLVPDLPAGISDDSARDFVRRQQFASGKVYDGHVGQADLDDALAAKLQSRVPGRITPAPLGSDRTGGGDFARDVTGLVGGGLKGQVGDVLRWLRNPRTAPSPLRMDGVWGSTSDFPLLETGRQVGSNIEDFFRGANWLGNRRAGMGATGAGRATRDLHFDYSELTQFEKNVMRNLLPFYTFSAKNLPAQAANVLRSPGQATAQLRVLNSGRDEGGFVPGYLRSVGAIPTGPEKGGVRQFLTSFGTPIEEALGRLQFKGGLPDLRGTAMGFAGLLNPIIKAPLEQLTDTQLHTGRKLSEIRPSSAASALGRLVGDDNPQLLSQVLANTPAARFLTTLDRLADDRKSPGVKALGLLTGLGLQDVDVGRARAMEAAQTRDALLSRMPHVRSRIVFYVRPDDVPDLSGKEIEMLRMLATMQQAAREKPRPEPARIGVRIP